MHPHVLRSTPWNNRTPNNRHTETEIDEIPQEHKDGIDMAREYLRGSHVLVVCGNTVGKSMKNDIAMAERLKKERQSFLG